MHSFADVGTSGRGSWRKWVLIAALVTPFSVHATENTAAQQVGHACVERFLARDDGSHSYRAARRLEADAGDRHGWMEAITEFSPRTGFRYEVTAEGGSGLIRSKILRCLLDGERDAINKGTTKHSELIRANYKFQPKRVDSEGVTEIALTPLREDMLVIGSAFIRPAGELVRLQGRLAKSPSFWIRNVQVMRSYETIHDVVVPIVLETSAQLRMFGAATLRMTYAYLDIDGHPVNSTQVARK
jgi:hypothetical protein